MPIKVFKFGGASVKDATAVKNLPSILQHFRNDKLLVVVSAMGKTTNALEKVVHAYFNKDAKLPDYLLEVKEYHTKIISELGFKPSHPLHSLISNCLTEIEWIIEETPSRGYAFAYDQVVSQGELMSTHIVSAYLNENGYPNQWLDARDVIQTDNSYREGTVDWELTGKLIRGKIPPMFETKSIVMTQGFIGSTSENFTTTLGREGSDYSAAIFSHCLDANEMIVWKDVPGVLSADPKYYDDTVKLEQIGYLDAIELTYYGASVIHPKTIKPLENKNIPLQVRSFKTPGEKGTVIGNFNSTKPLVPCFIFKVEQILISISVKDFSFVAEAHLSRIFALFAYHHVKINLTQNSAVSFSVCVDNDPFKIPALLEELKKEFKVLYNDHLRLVTVRHYYPSTIDRLIKDKTVLVEQRSRNTAQVVIKE